MMDIPKTHGQTATHGTVVTPPLHGAVPPYYA